MSSEVAQPSVGDFIVNLLKEKQPRLTGEVQVAVAEAFKKMTPAKTNKELQQLFETGVIVKRRTKEQDQATGKYSDVWHFPGADDTVTYVQEIQELIDSKCQETAVVIGTRFQMLLADRIRKSGAPDDLINKIRPTHQELVVLIRRCVDDAIAKNEWPWSM